MTDIVNRFSEIVIDSTQPFYFFGILIISALMAIGIIILFKSNMFRVGTQYKYVMKNVTKSRKKKKKLDTKSIEKDEIKRNKKQELELNLLRLRWNMNYEELQNKLKFNILKGTLIGFTFFMIGIFVFEGALQYLMMGIGLFSILWGILGLNQKLSKDKKQLDKDIVKDLARMVSLYKFSDTTRGFYGLVQDYLETSNSLKKDLEFYIADLNSYGEEEALDRLGDRVKLTEMFKLITYIKSSSTATKAVFETNLQILDRELTEELKELQRRESNKKFLTTMLMVIPLVFFTGSIIMSSQVVMIMQTFVESAATM